MSALASTLSTWGRPYLTIRDENVANGRKGTNYSARQGDVRGIVKQMTDGDMNWRVKFYGLKDQGTYFHAEQAVKVLERYDPSATALSVSDVLQLYNTQLFVEHSVFPASCTDKERETYQALIPKLRTTVGRFFSTIRDETLASVVVDVEYQYHSDLLELFARHKVYDRCSAATVLSALEQTNIGVGAMLTNQRLVQCYDQDVRTRLISDPRNAECLIGKYLDKDAQHPVYLPASFTDADARALLDSYLDYDDANPNFIRLIVTARPTQENRIDAKLKLKAKRKHDAWTEEFFRNNAGMQSGSIVSISDTQADPVTLSQNGLIAKFSYSRRWLEEHLDSPTVLNNFLYLFEFADHRMLLTLPSFQADLGVHERFMGVTGKTDYRSGIVFRFKDESSFLQTALYTQFLQTRDIELESVIAWFFAEYLKKEFGATNFTFIPSSKTSSYLEKARHLFSEMESVIKQFSLFAQNGELDTDLLTITSDPVVYKKISSLLAGKYVYPDNDNQQIQAILYLLFSDQSGLTYINDNLRATNGAQLLFDNQVAYDDFYSYQKPSIDYLLDLGVLENADARVQLADIGQFRILQTLFHAEAASYYHYPAQSRLCIDDMVAKGWLVREDSLLTHTEGSYFNYYLNQSEFSDGPDLRNKYLHGTQAGGDDERLHFSTYITALKLLIALVIKMNDEFWLRDEEGN
jgi:hypothetical protein